jgi:CarD family transcriptional regulator
LYQIGDKVFHPVHGAGTVVEIKERRSLGNAREYYSISLLGQPKTVLMVPVQHAQEIGLRPPLQRSDLARVWNVLKGVPETLPTDHEQRYELIKDRLRDGNALHIAAALRDMAWREETERRLTKQGQQLYEESLMLLAGEVAIVQDSNLASAEAQIVETLRESVETETAS